MSGEREECRQAGAVRCLRRRGNCARCSLTRSSCKPNPKPGASRRKMLFALVPVQQLAKYGNSNSYFCDPYKNDITHVAIGTHGACGSMAHAAVACSCLESLPPRRQPPAARRCRRVLTPHAREQAWMTDICPCRTRIPRRQ